ncbi:1-deoxy-D-xylulose-5-phosphate synthase [Amedibacillus sp. YH-ame10]
MYLEKINSPLDVKALDTKALEVLSQEIREVLLKKLSVHGGHIGPNLGLVELSIALHYVFDSPTDKMVFDVSHQSYVHKILTGRKSAFIDEDKYDEVSGYTNPSESEHDFFTIGHTSTSVSLACGLAKARDLQGEKGNVIAIIGDGSLSGGEAFEGLNYIGETGGNMIIIVNDNGMSIAENHGGMYEKLKQLRESKGTCVDNYFKGLNLDYCFVEDGHDIEGLISTFETIKDRTQPIVVHVCTTKGKGYKLAETDKEHWHWNMPFDLETGKPKFTMEEMGYDEFSAQYLLNAMKEDPKVVAITSGTPAVFGFHKEQRIQAGKQFIDVGIAEEHAVALASGIAKGGGKPVYGVYSTFLQRTYDQLSHDLCINKNPALVLVFAASVYGMNDETHLGLFDIAMMGNIPNMVYLAPTCMEEYEAMLHWGLHQEQHPVAIRVPVGTLRYSGKKDESDYALLNTYQMTKRGGDVAILALGNFYSIGENVVEQLDKEHGIKATLINPKYITGLDTNLLDELKKDHKLVITLEDGILEGGFGEKIARYYGTDDMMVKTYGIKKSFPSRYDVNELLKEHGIQEESIVNDIKTLMKKKDNA